VENTREKCLKEAKERFLKMQMEILKKYNFSDLKTLNKEIKKLENYLKGVKK
jgi:3-keto-L-gulonate-6-phosphate decarboxylase